MPEEEKKQDLVDIDTSGPGAEVELEEEKVKVEEVENEEVKEEPKALSGEELAKRSPTARKAARVSRAKKQSKKEDK